MRKLGYLTAAIAGALTLGGAAIWITVRPWWLRWGVDPEEAVKPLPGDDVVPNAPIHETRAVTIDAPPAAVWPWLVQMGFGRAGWYSYDVVDMKGKSADQILPEFQALAVGDVAPTHPGGGFKVKAIEPDHALVLYLDTDLARSQAEAANGTAADSTPANLRAGGALMGAAQPTEFAASWAFVVEPLPGNRTRLIERLRVTFSGGDRPWSRLSLPVLGFGVFVMIRKQLLGIRSRAERGMQRPIPVA